MQLRILSFWINETEGGRIIQSETDFEISAVAASPLYRGKGLADRCVKAVEQAAVKRGKEQGKKELKLWLRTVEHHNRAYWTKRGFTEVETRRGPAGMWGAERDFVLLTMMRPAERI